MGYRNYISKIRKEDLAQLVLLSPSNDNEAEYERFYDFKSDKTTTLHEIGKYYEEPGDYWNVVHDFSDCDTEYKVVDKESLKAIINQYSQKHISYLETLANTPSVDELKKQMEAETDDEKIWDLEDEIKRVERENPQSYVESQLKEWKRGMVLDLREESTKVAISWSYQYSVFNLVNIYKTFNFDKYYLVYEGY